MDAKLAAKPRKTKYALSIFVVLFSIVLLWPFITTSIKPGMVGVLYFRLFVGTVRDKVYGEGLHFLLPWDIMYHYNARVREYSDEIRVLSRDGLPIVVRASIRYRIIRTQVTELHVNYGPNYENILIKPIFESSIREAVGSYRPEELYSKTPQEIQNEAVVEAVREVMHLPVTIEAIIIKRISLPKGLTSSIEEKLVEEQQVLRYDYVLQRTYKEALRKVIESEGVRLFQETVNPGLTNEFLRFKGIEATLGVAASDNSKIVLIGNNDGLPLILNAETMNQAPLVREEPEEKRPTASPAEPIKPPEPLRAHGTAGADERISALSDHLRTLWESLSTARIPIMAGQPPAPTPTSR